LSERAQLGAQALDALSCGLAVSDLLTIDIITAAVRSVHKHHNPPSALNEGGVNVNVNVNQSFLV